MSVFARLLHSLFAPRNDDFGVRLLADLGLDADAGPQRR